MEKVLQKEQALNNVCSILVNEFFKKIKMIPWKLIIEIVGVCCAVISLIVMCVITFSKLPKLSERVNVVKIEYDKKNAEGN